MPLVIARARRWAGVAALACLAGSAGAQESVPRASVVPFEGIVSMRLRSELLPPEGTTMRYLARPGALRMELGPAGDLTMYTLLDAAKREMYSVMPAQQMYMAIPVPDSATVAAITGAGKLPAGTTERLGRRETVAGLACEMYRVAADTLVVDSCIATDVPSPFPALGRPAATPPAPPAGAAVLPAGLLLRMTRVGTAYPMYEVTHVERRPLDAALFELPAGYTRMELPPGMLPRP